MARQKPFLFFPLLIFVLLLTLVAGNWSATYADNPAPDPSVPPPQPRPTATSDNPPVPVRSTFPPPPVGNRCSPAYETVKPDVEGLLGCYPWVVYIPTGASCLEGIAVVYDLPIASNPPPYHWKMYTAANAFEVRQYSSAQLVKDPPCGNLNIIYYLNSSQRQIFDNTPAMLSIYHYEESTQAWTECKPTLVTDVGINGVLVCSVKSWGFFALGRPSGQ